MEMAAVIESARLNQSQGIAVDGGSEP